MGTDKFLQPTDAIEVTHNHLSNTLISPDVVASYAKRIADGEDREKVLTELAQEIVELEDGLRKDGLLPPLEIPDHVLNILGDVEGHPFHGNQWTGGQGGKSPLMDSNVDIVKRRVEDVAHEMGLPIGIVDVVDKEPREFTVGDQNYKEAGHYNPATGTVQINARNSYDMRMSVTKGIAAHEFSHAIYDAARRAQSLEHEQISNLPKEEYNRLYRASGYARPEMQKEIHERWPVSAMFYRHTGDSFMETEDEQKGTPYYLKKITALEKDDGVSAYSTSYWKVKDNPNGLENAINETLAETARHLIVPLGKTPDDIPKARWTKFSKDLQAVSKLNKVRAQIGRRG